MAKQNLNWAICSLDDDSPLVFRIWRRPFQLDPTLRKRPVAKAGATPSVAKRDRLWLKEGGNASDMASLQARGAERGVAFSFDGAVTNTRDSLRLVLWAQSLGRNEQLMTALGWRHFGEDMLMADRRVLLDACEEAGLARRAAADVLDSGAFGDDVDASHTSWNQLRRVTGIPVIIFRVYHPHIDFQHPTEKMRFDGSVAAADYAAACRDIERHAREPSRWRFEAAAAAAYDVVHAPAVAVRAKPTTASPVLRWHRPGTKVKAYGVVDGKWLKLETEPGWMLLVSDQYGVLLRPAPDDADPPPPVPRRKGAVLRVSDL